MKPAVRCGSDAVTSRHRSVKLAFEIRRMQSKLSFAWDSQYSSIGEQTTLIEHGQHNRSLLAAEFSAQAEGFLGRYTLTTHPLLPGRFASSSEPPCASAICRDSTSPMPLPSAFVV